jgi:hypothetical protein
MAEQGRRPRLSRPDPAPLGPALLPLCCLLHAGGWADLRWGHHLQRSSQVLWVRPGAHFSVPTPNPFPGPLCAPSSGLAVRTGCPGCSGRWFVYGYHGDSGLAQPSRSAAGRAGGVVAALCPGLDPWESGHCREWGSRCPRGRWGVARSFTCLPAFWPLMGERGDASTLLAVGSAAAISALLVLSSVILVDWDYGRLRGFARQATYSVHTDWTWALPGNRVSIKRIVTIFAID